MGRLARYSDEQILDAAGRLVADRGPGAATIGAIAGSVGAPTGSIYHRFPSRDVLMAELWLATVATFQDGFVAALETGGGLAAALYTPRWVRAHPDRARVLLLHRREDLVAGGWPPAVAERAEHVNDPGRAALRAWARSTLGSAGRATLRRARFALVDVPGAAVRPHLQAGERPPRQIDELIALTYHATIEETP